MSLRHTSATHYVRCSSQNNDMTRTEAIAKYQPLYDNNLERITVAIGTPLGIFRERKVSRTYQV